MSETSKEDKWVGLTEKEIKEVWLNVKGDVRETVLLYARAIEAKLKEKNT